jgi:hypothetical protein
MPDEVKDQDEIKSHADFDAAVEKQLGKPTAWEDLEDDPEFDTPVLPSYEDDSGGMVEPKKDEKALFSSSEP